MNRYITIYETVRARRTRNGKCPVCNTAVSRSRTFEMTVNPWNKNADGSVRTWDEVHAAVNAKADEWNPDFTHGRCSK